MDKIRLFENTIHILTEFKLYAESNELTDDEKALRLEVIDLCKEVSTDFDKYRKEEFEDEKDSKEDKDYLNDPVEDIYGE